MTPEQEKALRRLRNRQVSRRNSEKGVAKLRQNVAEGRRDGSNPDTGPRKEQAKREKATPLKEVAEEEIRLQLKHRDPKVRANAARLALELDVGRYAEKDSEEPLRRIVFETVALYPGGHELPPPAPPIL